MQMAQKGQNFEDEIRNREMMFQAMSQGWGEASTFHTTQRPSTCSRARR